MSKENEREKSDRDELLEAFIDKARPPEGQGSGYLSAEWVDILIFVPLIPLLLLTSKSLWSSWVVHFYSLFAILFFIYMSNGFRRHMSELINPFDFLKFQFFILINVIVFFGVAYHTISDLILGQFNYESISFIDSIYFSFVTISTLGYGDFYPEGAYTKILIVFEICFGFWFILTVIPVAVADQSELIKQKKIKNKKFQEVLKRRIEDPNTEITKLQLDDSENSDEN